MRAIYITQESVVRVWLVISLKPYKIRCSCVASSPLITIAYFMDRRRTLESNWTRTRILVYPITDCRKNGLRQQFFFDFYRFNSFCSITRNIGRYSPKRNLELSAWFQIIISYQYPPPSSLLATANNGNWKYTLAIVCWTKLFSITPSPVRLSHLCSDAARGIVFCLEVCLNNLFRRI